MKRYFKFTNIMLLLGLLFIYLPMMILVVYSFNASKMVVVWENWSVKWYSKLAESSTLISALLDGLQLCLYISPFILIIITMTDLIISKANKKTISLKTSLLKGFELSFYASIIITVSRIIVAAWVTSWFKTDTSDLILALFRSLEVAFYTSLTAVVLGTLAAFVLTRINHFRGRSFFAGMVTAPLVMPEIITGFSLLLLFMALNDIFSWPNKGLINIWIAHVTFCTTYVAIIVSSRLRELDRSMEEAAMDLGAPPWKTFIFITIPMIAPSLAAGAMLSFALSLDDVVLANFLSGPGSTTLPVFIFSKVRLGVDPQINAIATIILLTVSTFTLAAWFVNRRLERRRKVATL